MQVDNRMRAWYQKDMSTGLLYICSLGGLLPVTRLPAKNLILSHHGQHLHAGS